MTLAHLADELYTAYQYFVSQKIGYASDYDEAERLASAQREKGKLATGQLFGVVGYDVLDEVETKIAAVMSLRNQGIMTADYLDQYRSASTDIMKLIFSVMDKLPANTTIQEVLDQLMTEENRPKVEVFARGEYRKDFNIDYQKSDFTSAGLDELRETIVTFLLPLPENVQYFKDKKIFSILDKLSYLEPEVDRLVKIERKKLNDLGVGYRFAGAYRGPGAR